MTPIEILKAARSKIEDPKHWIQGALSYDVHGNWSPPENVNTTCWCAVGALESVDPYGHWVEARKVLDRSAVKLYPDSDRTQYDSRPIVVVNDKIGHSEVMACFSHAIASLEAVPT